MVFTTPYSKRTLPPEVAGCLRRLQNHDKPRSEYSLGRAVKPYRLSASSLLALALFFFGVMLAPWASAQSTAQPTVQLSDFKLERQDDAYVLSSTLSFELPPAVEDALSKGIALYFMAEVQVAKERWYWYDKYVARQERHYRLSYNPLSRRWRLVTSSKPISNSGLGVSMGVPYDALSEALSAIKRSGEWRIVEAAEIEPGGKYRLDYQFKLDLTQFPRPLQIGTLGESDWTLSVKKSQALVFEPAKSP